MENRNSTMEVRSVGLDAPGTETTRVVAGYLFTHRDVPTEIISFAKSKLGDTVSIHPPRKNASYKGFVLLNTADWLIQIIGRDRTAIIHRKADVLLVGSLRARDRNKRLIGAFAQLHYNNGRAKAYPLTAARKPELKGPETGPQLTGIER